MSRDYPARLWVPDGVMDHMLMHLFSAVLSRDMGKVDCTRIIHDYLDSKRGLRFSYGSLQLVPDGFAKFVWETLDKLEQQRRQAAEEV